MDAELLGRRLLRWCLAIGLLTGAGLIVGALEGLLAPPLPHESPWQRASTGMLVDGLAGVVLGSALGWTYALGSVRPARTTAGLAMLGPAVLMLLGLARLQQLDTETMQAMSGPLRLERPLPPLASETPRLVLLVTLDTFRADALAAAPSLRRRLERGRWFIDASAAASWTLPSIAAMHTGLDETRHGAGIRLDPDRTWLRTPLDPSIPTLAEAMQDRGFVTAAVTSNPFLGRSHGLDRGFDRLWDLARANVVSHALRRGLLLRLVLPQRLARADAVTDRALALAERMARGRGMLWVHYTDPHAPYRRDAASRDPLDPCTWPDCFGDWRAVRRGEADPDRQAVRALYEADITYLDGELERLFAGVEALGVEPLVVLAGDHGESFGPGDDVEHGHTFSEDVLRVPLGAWGPGVTPAHIDEPVDVRLVFDGVLGWTDHGRWRDPAPAPLPMRSLLFGSPAQACIVDGIIRTRREMAAGEDTCIPDPATPPSPTSVKETLGLEMLGYLQ